MSIETERLSLREFSEDDAEATNAYERLPRVVRYTTHGTRTLAESLEYIKLSRATAVEVPRRTFDLAVVLREEQRLVGRCGLRVVDVESREATLWYILHPEYWGRGIIVEATRALLGYAFGELDVHRIFVDLEPANTASARVAEKLGMRREAHFVENAFVKGEWTDSVIYGLLDREWAVARTGARARHEGATSPRRRH